MLDRYRSPYQNESEAIQIGDLTIENRVDRVSIHGSVDITRDKEGFQNLRQLKAILDLIAVELERSDLPDRIAVVEPEAVKNPFE